MRHVEEDLPPSSLRGRLCEVFFSALVSEMIDPLLRRLGDKAMLDDPIFGPTTGLEALRARLTEWSGLLNEHDAQYERTTTLVGADRDVTEGLFEVRSDGHHKMVPVAVLMERKREREVALRIYLGSGALGVQLAKAKGPKPIAQTADTPAFAAEVLAALAESNAARVAAAFEEDGALRDAAGVEHSREAVARVIGGRTYTVESVADDGRTCAVEASTGDRLVLFIFQRGDSGLVRSMRLYSEL